ncbi:myoneurin-like [Ostrinia nubilalis]|uniref:myoneurin-like n=1 Tax=Ostrinia nubilalis TaxID=29057 RepID=UPI00308253B9
MNVDKISQDNQLEGFCRGCLIKYDDPSDLLQYTEKNRRLFVYSTGLQVKRNDTFTFHLCKECYMNMKLSCKFKKQCRTSDKRFKNYLRLKEISDVDLCTFLKNSDDTLKFPLLSGNSTPANQKNNKEDDNESTCTSIQNFMTDILKGTEMPDTEARIIKEVIEEEADVLEDSLDSHWLQDDVSIDTDFRLDFSFSPFSTTKSINNDHCYTPRKQNEASHNIKNNHVKDVFKQLPTSQDNYDVDSVKDISINGIKEVLKEICGKTQVDLEEDFMQDNLIEECIDVNEEIPIFEPGLSMPVLIDPNENYDEINKEVDNVVDNIEIQIDPENDPENDKKHLYVLNDFSVELSVESNGEDLNMLELTDNKDNKKENTECSIDKKLKQALENNKKNISLDDLLVSPAEAGAMETKSDDFGVATPTVELFPDAAGASTPMINNILFGEKLELDDSNSAHKVGQCIEKFEDVGGDIDMLEDFFQKGVKEFDESLAKVINCVDITENIKTEQEEYIGVDVEDLKSVKIEVNSEYDLENCFCIICHKKFQSEKALKCHLTRLHKIRFPKKKYVDIRTKVCPRCGKVFDDRGNFWRHVRAHDKREYKCGVCTLLFASEWALNQHARVHNTLLKKVNKKKDDKYMCTTCGARFSLSCNLAAHMRRHAPPTLKCDGCPKLFYRPQELKSHQRQ